MEIKDAQYVIDLRGGKSPIEATIDGVPMTVPQDPANTVFAEIQKQVKAGTLTIKDAD